ncbi:helix-turn-helix domain-containing protein [Streptomyces endophytica]|uniref:Helix-turn-helix domain-containing protein n=1 Tax=Streptomyces endophytica TaxID=2991496 RepID=A0ABY6PIP8_9ACTN|nr:helix-turn-helix domain-containing protein [Streptomyces endophytica]UZJ33779.1 helix-turn-helix domain-containing protein [Streptomyces endophytica]
MPSIAVAVTDGIPFFELAIPCHIFGFDRIQTPPGWYDLRVCAIGADGAAPRTGPWFHAQTPYGIEELVTADTVLVPGSADVHGDPPDELVAALREAHRRGARLVSLCSGAFTLAATGLLDGRTAATHWMYAALLAERYPAVTVDSSVLYVDHGDVLTGAGSTAAIDVCLHLVREDFGTETANSLARQLVAPAHRPGGQAQYIETPLPERRDDSLAPLLHWATERLRRPLTVADLARRANTSPRTLVRRFHAATGTTPMQWLQTQRIGRARELLERTDLPVDRVAELSGLGSAANLRRHFTRTVGVPPNDYRRSYRATNATRTA